MSRSVNFNKSKINLSKGELCLVPTRVVQEEQEDEDFSDFSSEEELINDNEEIARSSFMSRLENICSELGYDLDGRLQFDDMIFNSYIEATNFSPFVIGGKVLEMEAVVLWDFHGGNGFADLNVSAGDTVYLVAEEYQTRVLDEERFIRLPFQWSLARWISGRPIDPYLGLIPSHYIVPKKFYHENPFLFKHPVWFHGNCEVHEVLRRLFSDRSALHPGLFAIFSPPWLNPDPRDLRCYFLMILVERNGKHDKVLMDFLKLQNNESPQMSQFLDDKLAEVIENKGKVNIKSKLENERQMIDFLCEIEATPFAPTLLTITRSPLGHFELMSNRYETLYDLVYYLANHRSPLPHKLVYDQISPDVCQPKFVPPPVQRFEKDIRAQPMTIEQWAAMHFDEITRNFEQKSKFQFVTKSVFDSGKKLHEKLVRKFMKRDQDVTRFAKFAEAFNRPEKAEKKAAGGGEKEKKTKKSEWSKMPKFLTSIAVESPFHISLKRVKCGQVSLGSGAFGSVQVGSFQSGLDRWIPVAVKKLKLKTDSKAEKNQAFSEIEILQMLTHPNVVLFYGFSIDQKTKSLFLLFELMDTSLDKFVEKAGGKLSENERLDILAQICRGMSYLHTRTPSVVHGDLAARNILLKKHIFNTRRLVAKITDLGLAKLCRSEFHTSYSDPNKIPFKWLPPEVLGPRILSPKTDVWAFGMICFEIYGIGEPYGMIQATQVYQYLMDGYRFNRLDNMSPCILEIVLKCWRMQPVDRPSFSEIARQFEKYIIEEDEEDEIVQMEREKFMSHEREKSRKERKIKKLIEANPDE